MPISMEALAVWSVKVPDHFVSLLDDSFGPVEESLVLAKGRLTVDYVK